VIGAEAVADLLKLGAEGLMIVYFAIEHDRQRATWSSSAKRPVNPHIVLLASVVSSALTEKVRL
jgi:hypothetical protein